MSSAKAILDMPNLASDHARKTKADCAAHTRARTISALLEHTASDSLTQETGPENPSFPENREGWRRFQQRD